MEGQLALDGTPNDGDAVVAGMERVADGVRTEPSPLSRGSSYRLTVVCPGHRSRRRRVTPKSAAVKRRVSCDRAGAETMAWHLEKVWADVGGRCSTVDHLFR